VISNSYWGIPGITLAGGLAVALTAGALAEEQESAAIGELLSDAENCITLSRIDRTEIVDDSNILFYLRGGKIYLNQLSRRCPGLRRNKPIMYRTSLNRLCNLDTITVMDHLGFGYSPGVSCGLEAFHPISEEAANVLRAEAKK